MEKSLAEQNLAMMRQGTTLNSPFNQTSFSNGPIKWPPEFRVSLAILGADNLRHFKFQDGYKGRKLRDTKSTFFYK